MSQSKFERRVQALQGSFWCDALVEVMDTAEGVYRWCEDRAIEPAIDLAALTELVIRRHDTIASDALKAAEAAE